MGLIYKEKVGLLLRIYSKLHFSAVEREIVRLDKEAKNVVGRLTVNVYLDNKLFTYNKSL